VFLFLLHVLEERQSLGFPSGRQHCGFAVAVLCVGGLTYLKIKLCFRDCFWGRIRGGSLAVAGLSHGVPVIVVAYGSLWAGAAAGLLVGLTLTAGERR